MHTAITFESGSSICCRSTQPQFTQNEARTQTSGGYAYAAGSLEGFICIRFKENSANAEMKGGKVTLMKQHGTETEVEGGQEARQTHVYMKRAQNEEKDLKGAIRANRDWVHDPRLIDPREENPVGLGLAEGGRDQLGSFLVHFKFSLSIELLHIRQADNLVLTCFIVFYSSLGRICR